MIERIKAYWKSITAITASVAALIGTLYAGGGYLMQVGTAIANEPAQQATIEQLVEFQRAVVAEKEADLKANQRVMDERTKLCLSGKLTDKELCATVGVAVE